MVTSALDDPYVRLAIYILALVLIYLLVPKLWRFIGKVFGARSVRLEGKQIEPFDKSPLEPEVLPSNKGISLGLFESEDPRDTAEGIAQEMEEWARQNRH